jgi:hypothetical protein
LWYYNLLVSDFSISCKPKADPAYLAFFMSKNPKVETEITERGNFALKKSELKN